MSTEPSAATAGTANARSLLTGRFGWFFAGRTVDLFGSSMTTVALALAVLQASGRASDLGLVLAANMIPTLVLMLVGGVIADRYERRTVLVAANTVSFGATGALALILLTHHYSLVAAMSCGAVSGAASAFASPALRGIVAELAPAGRIQQANALLASARNTVRILGPSVAGVLVATAGGGWAVAADALSYAVAAVLLTRIPRTPVPTATTSMWQQLGSGWSAFASLKWVVTLTITGAALNAANVGSWNVLGPSIIGHADGPVAWGAVLSVRAVGLLISSTLLVRFTFAHPLRTGRMLGALAAVPLAALGLGAPAWIVAAAAFIGAIGFSISGITWDTALQRHVPTDHLSRVSAYDDLLSFIAIPASQIATAPLAAAIGARNLALAAAALYAVSSLAPLLNPTVRNQA